MLAKYFVVKRTTYLVVEASSPGEALRQCVQHGREMCGSSMCTHETPIEVEMGDKYMEPFAVWDKAKILGVDRL